MVSKKQLENLKKGTPFNSESAREAQRLSNEKRKANMRWEEMMRKVDEDGIASSEFLNIMQNGKEENKVKVLSMVASFLDKEKARSNGELDNKVYVYEPMEFKTRV